MVQMTLTLIGPLITPSHAGTLPGAGAVRRGPNGSPGNFLVSASICLYMQTNGGPFWGKSPHTGLPACILPSNGCLRIPTGHVSLHITPHPHTITQKYYHNNDQSRQIFGLVRSFLAAYHTDYH